VSGPGRCIRSQSAAIATTKGNGPRVARHRRTRILIRLGRAAVSSGVGFSTGVTDLGATGTITSTGAEQAKAKADAKVQLLLAEVLRRCDSILEVLGGTGGGVVLSARGGIDTAGSAVLDAGVGIVLELDASSGILTSVGADATRRGTQDGILTQAHGGSTSGDDMIVLLTGGGFRWPVGGELGMHGLGTGAGVVGGEASSPFANDGLGEPGAIRGDDHVVQITEGGSSTAPSAGGDDDVGSTKGGAFNLLASDSCDAGTGNTALAFDPFGTATPDAIGKETVPRW
jgi:hypothetical protein